MHHPQDPRSRGGTAVARLIAMGLGTLAAACGGEQEAGEEQQLGPGVQVVADSGPAADAPEAPAAATPPEIYYDLTAHTWYREGQPLQHGGVPYQARSRPIRTTADSLQAAGRFEEVDYYRRTGAPEAPDTLFVPVYPGYWQPFLRGGGSGGG